MSDFIVTASYAITIDDAEDERDALGRAEDALISDLANNLCQIADMMTFKVEKILTYDDVWEA